MRRQLSKSPYGTLKLQQMIGKGSYGHIYKAYANAQNKQYAVKIISSDCSPQSLVNIQRQIKILTSCNHSNIVKCYSVQIIDEMVWIVMDYYSRGSLADIMARQKRTFNQMQIKIILAQIIDALAYLHDKKIIHRDIKAANILIDDAGQIKVADFGVSTLISQSHKHTRTGSPLWMSPQLLANSKYSYKTDIWSLGITALQLAQGVPPYSHQHPYRAIFSIQSHPPHSLSQPEKWSRQFNNFVTKCLTVDESKRPSAKQLKNDEFITISSQQSSNQLKIKQTNKSNKQSYLQSVYRQNDGTMILHSQYDPSVWEKIGTISRIKQSQIKQPNVCGTFKINTDDQHQYNISPSLLKQINKGINNYLPTVQQNKQNQMVQILYVEMQQQIKKIRKKYLTKIRQIQQKSMLTFQQRLKTTNQKILH